MRIGTFLLGGVVGAAAVVYLNRKTGGSLLMSAFSSSGESVGKTVGKTKETFSGKSFTDLSAKSFKTSGSGLDKVEDIVKDDPSLKQTVNEILEDNQEQATTIQ